MGIFPPETHIVIYKDTAYSVMVDKGILTLKNISTNEVELIPTVKPLGECIHMIKEMIVRESRSLEVNPIEVRRRIFRRSIVGYEYLNQQQIRY